MENIIEKYRNKYTGVFNRFSVNKGLSFDPYIEFYMDGREDYVFDFDVYLPTKGVNLQRGLVWTLEQKQELIYSLILGRYIPTLTVIEEIDGYDRNRQRKLLIIDGKQRITTILSFLNNEFSIKLDDVEYYYKDFEYEYDYKDNEGNIQKSTTNPFNRSSIMSLFKANVFYSYPDNRFTDDDKIHLFELCNFKGTPQDEEHLKTLKS